MRIIETRRAPNPRRVRIFLAEKGLDVAFEERDLMAGDFQAEAILQLNPWGRAPILVLDDGRKLCESVAICRYFEALAPDPPLFGAGAFGAAEVEMWNRRVEHGLFAAVAHAFRHRHPKMAHLEAPQIAAWGDANVEKAANELARLDRRLSQSEFIAGDQYSIADITALVAVDFLKPARVAMPDGLANVARWRAKVSSRPSAAA
ncbi:MAG: glutathione S-transferase family protein [Hyphomicrobium sp.]